MPPKKKPQSREEILERKRKKERERYARIKNDPVRLAAYKEKDKQKYLKGKATGVIKTINEMTEREKRKCRKSWRARSSRYYKKKCAAKKATEDFIRVNTPSSMCEEEIIRNLHSLPIHSPRTHPVPDPPATQSPRLIIAKQRSIIQRRKRNKEIKEKDKVIQELKSKLNKYRKKVSKLKKQKEKLKVLTPNSKMLQMAENPETRAEVIKKALFGDNIGQQISENISKLKTNQEKEAANKLLLGPVVKKRKVWKTGTTLITYKKIWNMEKKKAQAKKPKRSLRKLVQEFLEDDKYSRIGAGKKEFIKRNNIRKQKRYRLDTLRNLHKEFLKTTNVVISYSMFTRLTPFWIIPAKVTNRDTCMCTLHSNMQLVTTALNKAKVFEVSSYQNLLTAVCCDRYNERCLERTCDSCYEKSIIPLVDFDGAMSIKYQVWDTKRETITDARTKKNRTVIKQQKITLETSARDLVQKLKEDLVTLFKHERNIVHQYQSIKMLKESLSAEDAIVHMDFSENYACKYKEEIQSFHFGGSRMQLSLHAVVVYLQNSSRSYCTVSKNLSHNVSAIWAHLQPVLEEIPHNIENIHFLSDGPVTQYRNKLMFYVLACKIPEMWPRFMYWTWNYHEAGHGKGAPDGVGATCKRSADHVVAMGRDVTNLTQFCGVVQNRCPNITLFTITDAEIEEMEKLISSNQPNLLPFKGTLQVHQVQGNASSPLKLAMKTLSCFCSKECEHFQMGIVKYSTIKANIDHVFNESEGESINAGSISILKSSDMVDITSALGLITHDLNGSLEGPDIDIDTNDLFPVEEKGRGKKRKINKNDILIERGTNCTKETKRLGDGKRSSLNEKKRTKLKSNKPVQRKEKKCKENESDDCSCLICGVLYEEDTTGQEWIQCIVCHLWAQINCIRSKTDLSTYTCSECLPDRDFVP